MIDSTSVLASESKDNNKGVKKIYATPNVNVYGNVRSFTLAGLSGKPEGLDSASTNKKN